MVVLHRLLYVSKFSHGSSSKGKWSSTPHDQNDKRKKKKITGFEVWLNFQAPSEVHHADHCHPGPFFSGETDK